MLGASSAGSFIIVSSDALEVVQSLREAGFKTDYGLSRAKMGKQFQAAEHNGATFAVIVGSEFPSVSVKTLASREEPHFRQSRLLLNYLTEGPCQLLEILW